MTPSGSERRMTMAAQAGLILIVSVGASLITRVWVDVFVHKQPPRAVTVQVAIPIVCAQCAENKEALDRCSVSWDEAFGGNGVQQPNSQCEKQLSICHREWADMFERQWAHDTDAAVPPWVGPVPCRDR